MKTPKTNQHVLRDVMRFSRYGALAELFVMDAVAKQARAVAETSIDTVRDEMRNHIVHPDAWHGVACKINLKLAAHLQERP